MEYSEQANLFCRQQTKNTRKKTGIMGGTFNPVHNGHIYMAQKARDEFGLDNVLFIPTGIPPHKMDEVVADKEHRFAMLELALMNIPYFQISRMELDRTGKTYTIDTLRMLNQCTQHNDFYFIIGADTLFELHSWKNFNEVITLTEFICFYRPGTEHEMVKQYADAIFSKYRKEIFVSEYEGLNISSCGIREKIAAHQPIVGMVPPMVEKYIFDNGVYR